MSEEQSPYLVPVTELGTLRKTPSVLSGIFVGLARQLFSSEFQDTDNGFLWVGKNGNTDTDESKSKIWIDVEYKWADFAPNFRPAIYVAISPLIYSTYSGTSRGRQGMDLQAGEYHYARKCEGTVSFVHIGNNNGESVKLAEQTLDFIDAFSDAIRNEYCFIKFFVHQFQPPQVIKEEREKFRSTIVVNFEFEETWTLHLQSQKVMRIVLNTGHAASDLIRSYQF